MRITFEKRDAKLLSKQTVLVAVFENEDPLAPLAKNLDEVEIRAAKRRLKTAKFTGKESQTAVFQTSSKKAPETVVWMGLGKKCDSTPESLLTLGVCAVRKLEANKSASGILVLPEMKDQERALSVRLVANGAVRAAYAFDRYKSEKKKEHVTKIVLALETVASKKRLNDALKLGVATAEAANAIRDLINEPPSTMNPKSIAVALRKLFAGTGVRVQIHDQKWLAKNRFHAHLAVGRGGVNPPTLVKLTYNKGPKSQKPTALVGKGVTFDSGGLSLKPWRSMTTMKCDMGGAATVAGVFLALAQLKARVNAVGYLGFAENMTGSRAYKPGDVLKGRSGKTIEVINTDAEGRLVLSDALAYASEQKPKRIIDLATLTGACMVALGSDVAGLFSDDDELVEGVEVSADANGEPVWRLPMIKHYFKTFKSDVADMKNIGGDYGGAINAALFLQQFVDEEIPWLHIDIAGPAFGEKGGGGSPMDLKGGTGAYVLSLTDYLMTNR